MPKLHDYSLIKHEILSNSSHDRLNLDNVKKLFEKDINSKRTYDLVASVGDLIKVLEKRDVLNEQNIEILKKIQNHLNISPSHRVSSQSFCKNLLENHDEKLKLDHKEGTPRVVPRNSVLHRITNDCPDIKKRIYRTICDEIGSKWKDLGRNLKVRECILDEFDDNLKYTNERAYEILRYHEENFIGSWKTTLLSALVESRRTDLKEKIEAIFDMYDL